MQKFQRFQLKYKTITINNIYNILEKYDVKILLALYESLKGRKDFFKFLVNNGYPELAAFSNAVRGDIDAMFWLFKNGFAWLAILSNACDGEPKAREWIRQNTHEVNFYFALACRREEVSLQWLKEHNLSIFLMMAKEVDKVLDLQMKENLSWYTMKF